MIWIAVKRLSLGPAVLENRIHEIAAPGVVADRSVRCLVQGAQTPGAPLALPPRGGNPALTDGDLRATLGHLRRRTGARSS